MKAGKIMLLTVALVLFGTWVYGADCNNGGRYEDMGDGTVQDCRTGLIWLKNANCMGALNWHDAMTWVKGLHTAQCQLTDGSQVGFWRLPTITEWMAMVAYGKKLGWSPAIADGTGTVTWQEGHLFHDVQSSFYWSATMLAPSPDDAWTVNLAGGGVITKPLWESYYVWPVRAGQVAGNAASFGKVTIE
jgi:hypothetical protein